jgi:hypothetical protein
MGGLLEAALEPKLKRPFIPGSGTFPHTRRMPPSTATRTAALALCAVLSLPAWAGAKDHERALQAVQSGQVLPLPAALERLAREQPGQVLEVELEQEGGAWIYEIKLLKADGRLLKVKLDARSGSLLRSRPRDGGR